MGDGLGEIENLAEPKLDAEGQLVRAALKRESRVARQMRQTRLMPDPARLLVQIAIGNPDIRHSFGCRNASIGTRSGDGAQCRALPGGISISSYSPISSRGSSHEISVPQSAQDVGI